MLLVVLIIMLTETVYAIECFFGEDVLVRDAEGMEAAFHDIEGVLTSIGNAMKAGDLSPKPQKDLDPCAYCRYKAVCRSAVPSKRR